jgi:hypothetical protein
MPRWVVILIVAPLALCVTCVSAGYFVARPLIDRGRDSVSDAMADAVAASVSRTIASSARPRGELTIEAIDLDVNNTSSFGEAGITTGTEGARIYGFVTKISPDGVALVIPPDQVVVASAVPEVVDGRVEIPQANGGMNVMKLFLSSEGFANGLEEGINRALEAHGLTPTAITLNDGSMTIRVDRNSQSAVGGTDTPSAIWVSR